MPKEKNDAQVKASTPAVAPETEQSLDDFCCRLSLTERRYCLISAFHYRESVAKRYRDLPSAYAKRFADYINPQAN